MTTAERKFRVRFGFEKGEFISIPTEKLAFAIYAMQTGGIFKADGKVIKGAEIKTITPDHHFHTGWLPWYEPKSADDFKQIERDCPKDYPEIIDRATLLAIRARSEQNIKLLEENILRLA